MKLVFDVQKSKELCPPKYPKGVRFIKRIVLQRSVVAYTTLGNPREDHIIWSELPPLKDSLIVNGYIHTQSPPTIKVDPDRPDHFIGLSGYHRDAACEQLDIQTMMYDVLEFDSPLDELKHKSVTNQHRTPALVNTKDDIIKQIKEAVDKQYISNEDVDVIDLISILAADKTDKTKKEIFKQFRTRVLRSDATILGYHTQGGQYSTEEFAEKYNIPCAGDKRYTKSFKRLGYITGINTPKTTLYDAKKLSMDYGYKVVEIYAWIQKDAKQAPGIYVQRQKFLDKWNEFVLEDCKSIQEIAKQCGKNISIDDILKNYPIRFVGFLAQNITPDPFNGGKPMEDGVVDVNGNPVVIKDNSIFTNFGNIVQKQVYRKVA
jgi:hypothetical protein